MLLGIWLMIKLATGNLSTMTIIISPTLLFLVGFIIMSAYSAYVGYLNYAGTAADGLFKTYVYVVFAFIMMSIIGYFSVSHHDDVQHLLRRIMPILFLTAFIRFFVLGISIAGYAQIITPRLWPVSLLLSLGLLYHLSTYLAKEEVTLKDTLVLMVFLGGVLEIGRAHV